MRLILFALFHSTLHAAPLCTVARTYLAPARHNPCFERLMTGAKSPADRKWLMDTAKTWSPPRDLVVTELPGGFKLARGAREIGSIQWLSVDPPVVFLDGKIKVGAPVADGSRAALVHQFFATAKTAFNFSPLPAAHAEDADRALMEKMTALFSFGDLPATAGEYIAGPHYAVTFPQVGVLKAWTTGQRVSCGAQGVENLSLPFGTDALLAEAGHSPNFTLTALGTSEFRAEGVVPGKKVVVRVEPGTRSLPCIDTYSQEQDKKYCNGAWEKFFAKNPEARRHFVAGGDSRPYCHRLGEKERARCGDFWRDWSKQFRSYSDVGRTQISLCQDDACKNRQPLSLKDLGERTTSDAERELKSKEFTTRRQKEVDAYVAFLKSNGIGGADVACLEMKCREPIDVGRLSVEKIAEARRLLPRLVNETDDGTVVQRIIQRGAMGALVLSECCAQKSCRDVAFKKLSVNLTPAPGTETSK